LDFSNQAGKGIMKARILAHRGLWVTDSEKNSKEAIALALSEGFGVELDVRDRNGGLIVSHDPSAESCPLILNELAADLDASPTSWIALNIKSDGLAALFPALKNPHFYFDMSFPERRNYQRRDMPTAERLSEFETASKHSLDADSTAAVWVDSFLGEWFLDRSKLEEILNFPGFKCFVSPELHGRPHESAWKTIQELFRLRSDVGICTDFPREFYAGL
jgi:glycerophosphoryl diester phosphodiesterase